MRTVNAHLERVQIPKLSAHRCMLLKLLNLSLKYKQGYQVAQSTAFPLMETGVS